MMMAILPAFAAAVLALSASHAVSQTYPAKPIRVLSTFGAGSVADGAIRLLAQKMAGSLGQPVVVEVQSGAGGVLAAQALIRSAPDGYTILHSTPATLVSTPFLLKDQPYHPMKDFTYITHLFDAGTCLLVTASLPVNTVKELIEYAKANPGKLAYGSNGVGGAFHLEMELLMQKYGLDITHVPYRGGQDGLKAAAAGQLPIAFAPAAPSDALARLGKVRVLAVLSVKRLAALPDIPSMGEQLPDYEKVPGGDEIVGPAGLPSAIVKRLNAEIVKALNAPEVLERVRQIGFVPVGNTPEEHAAQMKRAMEIMAEGARAARIKPE
jgi:tripartite-type tricarboxylate transporter receptor subunit TctC